MNSTVFEMIIRVFGAFLSIYSFAVLLQVPRRFVLQAGIVGAIGGFVYLLAIHFGRGDVMASLYSAVAAAVVSHIFARVYKTPVTLFLIAGVLPTVPGNGMYQTVHYLIDGNEAIARPNCLRFLLYATASVRALRPNPTAAAPTVARNVSKVR